MEENTIAVVPPEVIVQAQKAEYTLPYVLQQIALLQTDTTYLTDAVSKLAAMGDGDSGEPYSPGNVQGQAKAEALQVIIQSRETTNQKLLALYEKMYDDLVKQSAKIHY